MLGELQGDQLTRVPRGYLQGPSGGATTCGYKQFLGFREFEPAFATSDRFYPELLRTFKALTPLRALPEHRRSSKPRRRRRCCSTRTAAGPAHVPRHHGPDPGGEYHARLARWRERFAAESSLDARLAAGAPVVFGAALVLGHRRVADVVERLAAARCRSPRSSRLPSGTTA